jgi:hypothetical protein
MPKEGRESRNRPRRGRRQGQPAIDEQQSGGSGFFVAGVADLGPEWIEGGASCPQDAGSNRLCRRAKPARWRGATSGLRSPVSGLRPSRPASTRPATSILLRIAVAGVADPGPEWIEGGASCPKTLDRIGCAAAPSQRVGEGNALHLRPPVSGLPSPTSGLQPSSPPDRPPRGQLHRRRSTGAETRNLKLET